MDWSSLFVTLIGGLVSGGAVAALIVNLFQRKKTKAETEKLNAECNLVEAGANELVSKSLTALLLPLNNRIAELDNRVRKLETLNNRFLKRVAYLLDGIRQLICQIEDAKMKPAWQPDEWQPDQEG